MRRKWMIVALCLLVPVMMMLTTSCAKKVVKEEEQPTMDTSGGTTDVTPPPPAPMTPEESTPAPPPAPVGPSTMERNQFLEPIHFDYDSAVIKAEAEPILRDKADYLKRWTGDTVVIQGHCDERGTNEYNMALGDRRAEAAKNYLINLGVDASRISTISYGEEQPVDYGHNEEAWAKNRRDEFSLQ